MREEGAGGDQKGGGVRRIHSHGDAVTTGALACERGVGGRWGREREQ